MGMNGSEGRRPGGVAENLGRRDGIRAGAVSGPWRSAPKAETGPVRAVVPPPVSAPGPPVVEPVPDAEPATPDVPRDAPRARLTAVWLAVGIGLVAAVSIVGTAVLLRPGAETETPAAAAPAPAAVVEAPVVEAPAAAQTASPAAVVEVGSIRLRVGPEVAEDARAALVAALEGAGYGPVQVEVLPFPIAASRVGYYRAEDAAAAAELAEFVGGVLDAAVALSTRDYSQLLDGAVPGRLDIWIEG